MPPSTRKKKQKSQLDEALDTLDKAASDALAAASELEDKVWDARQAVEALQRLGIGSAPPA
jgi:hypothetical protein